MLEVDDPKLAIVFHMIAPMESLTPHLDSPLVEPMELLRKLAKEDISRIVTSLLEHEDTENSLNFEESQYEVFSPLNVGGGGSQYSNYHHELHDDTD